MADNPVNQNWLVSPTKEIEEMWVKVKIQEQKSKIVRWNQDVEDLMKGRILDFQSRIKMAELEIRSLENQLLQSQSVSAGEETQ